MEDNREKFESGSPSVGYRYLKGANLVIYTFNTVNIML